MNTQMLIGLDSTTAKQICLNSGFKIILLLPQEEVKETTYNYNPKKITLFKKNNIITNVIVG
jgi:hypothetical protein